MWAWRAYQEYPTLASFFDFLVLLRLCFVCRSNSGLSLARGFPPLFVDPVCLCDLGPSLMLLG
jgi:hypothetical protein